MSRFIGEDLTPEEAAVLQAVAHNCAGSEFARDSELRGVIEQHRECWLVEEWTDPQIEAVLTRLEAAGLIRRKLIATARHPEPAPHSGLTSDGRRCNLVDAWD